MRKKTLIKNDLGGRLLIWRKSQKLTLEKLAKQLGTGITTLSEIETNKSLPSIDTLARLYKKSNINIFWLMFKEEEMIKEEIKLDND